MYLKVSFYQILLYSRSSPIDTDKYELKKVGSQYQVSFKNIQSGIFYAVATAYESSFYTFYDFTLVIQCIDHCSECSGTTTCDVCNGGYTIDYDQTCTKSDELVDEAALQGFNAGIMASIFIVSGIQMQISPNLWVMINTLQILRTLLLLKIYLPINVRLTIASSSLFAQFEFGITNLIVPEAGEDEKIIEIMNGDTVLASYFEEYGIETYRFIDYTASVFFDGITIFIFFSLLSALWLMIYLKIKKKLIKQQLKKHMLAIFWFNGFIRLYLEVLLDGIIYIMVNIRSEKFIDLTMDTFSYILMGSFLILVIVFSIFQIIYTSKTIISKWKKSINELLVETNMQNAGVLMYHIIFVVRRIVLSLNAVLFGILGVYPHISIHFS